jgi:tetratricopeptide (TPR) repeat protein
VRPSAAAEKALFLYKNFFETYYAYYFRSTPERSSIQVALRVRPDAPPFEPTRLDVDSFEFLDEYSDGHLVQSRQHLYQAAATHFRRSWELSGKQFPWAREWWGAALYDGKLNGGMEILREVAREDPYSVAALLRLADRALQDRTPIRADSLFTRILEFDPDDAGAWMGRAEATRQTGNPEAAYEFAREGVRRCDVHPGYLMQLGDLARQLRDLDAAAQAYQRALAVNPQFEQARRALGMVQAMRQGTFGSRPSGAGREAGSAGGR